ncbi:MAG: NUDIX domain-containing protein [Anaerolineae bacterium]|nr:NUDIX domain-containing protein [Anaerolineae bacterium]MDW7991826.1 NUDIX domain-containing protein [Anaerolineae bacterium]
MSPILVVPRVLCFLFSGEDVLLLRHAPDRADWPGRYNGIGGHVEVGEDVRSAALREIAEEAGVPIADLMLRGIVHIAPNGAEPGVMMFVFTARALSRDVRASEEGTPVWVPLRELPTVDAVEDVPVILERVLAMGPDGQPFFGISQRDEKGRVCLFIREI